MENEIPNATPPGLVACDITGKVVPEEETVVLHGYRVCAEGKAELLERLKAGEMVSGELEHPTVMARFGAMFIDGLVFLPVVLVLIMIVGFSAFATTTAAGAGASVNLAVIATQLAPPAFGVAYFALMHGWRGQTLGKMAVRIKVVQANGQPISMMTAFLRALYYQGVGLLSGVLVSIALLVEQPALMVLSNLASLYFVVSVVWALFDKQQRAIHDLLARTRVVRLD